MKVRAAGNCVYTLATTTSRRCGVAAQKAYQYIRAPYTRA